MSLLGRTGDSCIIDAGCYANNSSCAVSATGDGEYLMRYTIARSIAAALEYTRCKLQVSCDFIIHNKNKDSKGDIGVLSIDPHGNFGIAFNSERMMRAWMTSADNLQIKIYR